MCRCNDEVEVKRQTFTAKDGRTLTARVVLDTDYDAEWERDAMGCLDDNGIALHCFHKKYLMPHVESLPEPSSFGSWEEMETEIESRGLVCFKVSMTDHGGLTCYLGSGRDMWDSGQIGFAVVDPKRHDDLEARARSIVSWLDALLCGSVYGVIVEDEFGHEVGSVWGFVGDADYCLREAIESAR